MNKSKIIAYNVPFTIESNALIDYHLDYLDALDDYTIQSFNDMQYIKHNRNIRIKLNISQDNNKKLPFNYLGIYNFEGSVRGDIYYYFITGSEWKSSNCVEVSLSLDRLNTFKDSFMPNFNNTTHIYRTHKDRFYRPITWNSGDPLLRKIDIFDEGINAPLYASGEPNSLISKDPYLDWYMVIARTETTLQLAPQLEIAFIPKIKVLNPNVFYYGTSTNYPVTNFDSIDRTQSKIIKIMLLPYAPFKYTISDFTYEDIHLKAINVQGGQGLTLNNDSSPIYRDAIPHRFVLYDWQAINIHNNIINIPFLDESIYQDIYKNEYDTYADIDFESKIYNNKFYNYSILYDNNIYNFDWSTYIPKYLTLSTYDVSLNIDFMVSTNTANVFAFKFDFVQNNLKLERDYLISNYDNYLIISRNNDVLLYNDEYLNYMRNGYNYDIKSKQIQEKNAWISTIAQSSSALSRGIATGNPVAIGTSLVSATASILTNINQQEANENQIAKTIAQKKAQGVNLEGVSDVALLEYMNLNELKYIKYRVSYEIRQMLFNLFHRYGYATDTYDIPNFDSRRSFNYIECDPRFDNEDNVFMREYLDDIKALFKQGVTIYHKFRIEENEPQIFDFEQIYENFETWICER